VEQIYQGNVTLHCKIAKLPKYAIKGAVGRKHKKIVGNRQEFAVDVCDRDVYAQAKVNIISFMVFFKYIAIYV